MENPPFWGYLLGEMVIFMGYVSFREGTLFVTRFLVQIIGRSVGICKFKMELGGGARIFWVKDEPWWADDLAPKKNVSFQI